MERLRTRPRAALFTACFVLALLGLTAGAFAATGHGTKSSPDAARTSTSGMGGMPMPVPIQPLGSRTWQGMKIMARLGGAVPFELFEGSTMRMVKPGTSNTHLMVMLSDAQTGMAIPYGTVWATVRKQGKIVFDERLWPMISRYMGTHFGNNMRLPGSGTYQLTLLVGPPQAARHMEYSKVWLKPHRVSLSFHWTQPK
jgi:hypothetical protein